MKMGELELNKEFWELLVKKKKREKQIGLESVGAGKVADSQDLGYKCQSMGFCS